MGVPDESETFEDGAIGFAVGNADENVMGFGVCAGGSNNTPYSFTSPDVAKSTLVGGPGLKWVLAMLAGGREKSVLFTKVNGSVAGSCGSVTASGTSPPTLTPSGAAYDTYDIVVQILQAGNRGTATFKYSLDHGNTWSQEIVTAATYLILEANVTLGFATGTPYASDNNYKFTTSAPGYVLSDLQAAYDAADASQTDWEIGHVLGQVTGSDNATMVTNWLAILTGMAAKVDASEAAHHFRVLVMEGPDVSDDSAGSTALNVVWNTFHDNRILPFVGFVYVTSPDDGVKYRRSSGWAAAYRARQTTPQRDLAAFADGPLPTWFTLIGSTVLGTPNQHDEIVREDLPRFGTLRSFEGETGVFITNAPIASSAGSDYRWLQHRRVIDLCARVSRKKNLRLLSSELRTYSGPSIGGPADEDNTRIAGTIFENDAQSAEKDTNTELFNKVTSKGYCQWVKIIVDRSELIEQTETFKYKLRLKMKTYPKVIVASFGFSA